MLVTRLSIQPILLGSYGGRPTPDSSISGSPTDSKEQEHYEIQPGGSVND